MKQNYFSYSGAKWLLLLLVQVILSTCSNDDAPTNRIPQLSVNEVASNVTSSQATIEGAVIDNGGFISRCGFMVNTAKGVLEKIGIDEASVHEATRNASGIVKVELKNLEASTTYYYCLFVVSGNTPIKSSIAYFTTEDIAEPTLSAVEVVETGEDFVTLRCRLVNDGGQKIQSLGFDYKLADAQTFRSVTVEGFEENTTDLSFVCTINELEPGTNYDFRATAYNGVKYGYSSIRSIQTNAKTSPTVSIEDLADTNIGVNYVMVAGKIEDTGASDITERGFLISTVSNPTMATDGVINVPVLTATDKFSATIDNLKPNTTYYVRAYAANNPYGSKTQYGYSKTLTFTTKDREIPSFSNIFHSDITKTSAKLSASITSNGVIPTSKGFKWGLSAKNLTTQEVTTDDFVLTLSDLNANATYYYQAYITYKEGDKEETQNSEQRSFTTQSIDGATLTNPEISNIGFHDATAKATATDHGDGELKKMGFVWSSSDAYPTLENNTGSIELAADAEFLAQLTGLTDDTRYYIRAYAVTEGYGQTVTAYSSDEWFYFTTLRMTLPSLYNPTPTEITQTTIKVKASLYDGGNTDVTEMGFCWSDQDIDPTEMTNKSTVTADNFTLTITDTEKVGNTYYIYAYATNGKGTAYSQKLTATLKYIPGQGDNPHPGKE